VNFSKHIFSEKFKNAAVLILSMVKCPYCKTKFELKELKNEKIAGGFTALTETIAWICPKCDTLLAIVPK
jgi:uncharacterized protein YbaR (Trm112 family)